MRRTILMLALALSATPALSQQMYKCPDPSGVGKFQQMPCSPTGGGEAVTVTPPKPGDNSIAESTARNEGGLWRYQQGVGEAGRN